MNTAGSDPLLGDPLAGAGLAEVPLERYVHRVALQTRDEDEDRANHLNNVALHALHGEARERLLREIMGCAVPRAGHTRTEYFSPSRYPSVLQVGLEVLSADAHRCVIRTAVFEADVCRSIQEAYLDFASVTARQALAALAERGECRPVAAPAPARLNPSNYPTGYSIALRFADLDRHGRLSARAIASLAETARWRLSRSLYAELGDRTPTWRGVVRATLIREIETHLPADGVIDARIGIVRIGQRSMRYAVGLFDSSARCMAISESATVMTESSGRSVPLDPEFRALVEHQCQLGRRLVDPE